MSQPCIQVQNLEFSWQGTHSSLINIPELSASRGEKVFIQGPSGSGKSTLLNLITGVLHPSNGDISILGNSLAALKPRHRDQFRTDHFGVIFQQFNLIPYLNVYENIALPCKFSKRRATRLEVDRETLQQQSQRLLNSLQLDSQQIGERNATELSTGQQQRVAVARALIGSPEIIIADEPTSALDEDAKQNFMQLLLSQVDRTNSTLLFVSHDKSLNSQFDRTIYFDQLNQAVSG